MTSFRFNLARVLQWYDEQLKLEHNRLLNCQIALSRAREALSNAQKKRSDTESAVVHAHSITVQDLRALELFRHGCYVTEKRLQAVCVDSQEQLDKQLSAVRIAQRKLRLLERLRDRRQFEHEYAANRELEDLATDAHLAKYARERISPKQ